MRGGMAVGGSIDEVEVAAVLLRDAVGVTARVLVPGDHALRSEHLAACEVGLELVHALFAWRARVQAVCRGLGHVVLVVRRLRAPPHTKQVALKSTRVQEEYKSTYEYEYGNYII